MFFIIGAFITMVLYEALARPLWGNLIPTKTVSVIIEIALAIIGGLLVSRIGGRKKKRQKAETAHQEEARKAEAAHQEEARKAEAARQEQLNKLRCTITSVEYDPEKNLFVLTWTKSDEAERYDIFVKAIGGNYKSYYTLPNGNIAHYDEHEITMNRERDDEFRYDSSSENIQGYVRGSSFGFPIYYFFVKPFKNGVGYGMSSNLVMCEKKPAALQNFTAKRRKDNTGILLQWTPCLCDGYAISKKVSSEYRTIAWVDNKDTNYYVDRNVEPEISYDYRVAAAFTITDHISDELIGEETNEDIERHACGDYAEAHVEAEN